MRRTIAAAARIWAAAASARWRLARVRAPLATLRPLPPMGVVLPFTPRPPAPATSVWRPRIRPQLRTVSERVIIAYVLADVPVSSYLAVHGWPVLGAK